MATPVIKSDHAAQQRPPVSEPERRRLVSYVLPVYNEAGGIQTFQDRLLAASQTRPDLDFEFIYVNDGSRDGSLQILERIAESCPLVRVVDLSRNFGHQMAITAGLDHARGDAVIVMDTDLQDPPEVSMELIAAWESGAQIVYAQRRSRKDTPMKRFTAHAYYRLLHRFADVDIPVDTGDFRLMDRATTDVLRAHRERNRFVRGLVASLGYKQVAVPFDRDERTSGQTNYPMSKMLRLAADGVTSFSTVPLKMITRLGVATVVLALLGIVYAIGLRLFFPDVSVPGWTLLMIMVLFLGGVQMLSLGVIGSYVGRIYTEVQGRPLYMVQKVVEHDRDAEPLRRDRA
ncbi:dolichol-phosphate mannosyltransferase [Geodermatophilus dictyosporus]|uniref:Dolichol-phosphate mannosyltransferase n=1 Tax=Geodermatophilus dictyosporus TaxID=1523247 RepID=A0A1I5LC28_9ACTN|nr:glycosyltransferase family 2 protein [Geodermatophilus dictyosporus]SFO94416.1 dolichol-phosphate mannosyltransferase [Geodermatophilus dictyosporus]